MKIPRTAQRWYAQGNFLLGRKREKSDLKIPCSHRVFRGDGHIMVGFTLVGSESCDACVLKTSSSAELLLPSLSSLPFSPSPGLRLLMRLRIEKKSGMRRKEKW